MDTKELIKFEEDPNYRKKVISRLHKEKDDQYYRRIKQLESEKNKLQKARQNEITRIANARWISLAGGMLWVNKAEGKVKFNKSECNFSDIQGAEVDVQMGYRVITHDNTKSKKSASLGGAVVGYAVLGPVGAVAGGVGLGKTKTTGHITTNQIPVCNRMSVKVNVNGFISEIVIISRQVDQASSVFRNAERQAQELVMKFGEIARTQMPQRIIPVYEENSVRAYDAQIRSKEEEIAFAKEDKPTYELPANYRNYETREMSDEEYLRHLEMKDMERAENRRAEYAEKEKLKEQRKENNSKVTIGKVLGVVFDIILWFFSLFVGIFWGVGALMLGAGLSGVVFIATGLFINPLCFKVLCNKVVMMPKWITVIVLVVGFFLGVMVFPETEATEMESSAVSEQIIEFAVRV